MVGPAGFESYVIHHFKSQKMGAEQYARNLIAKYIEIAAEQKGSRLIIIISRDAIDHACPNGDDHGLGSFHDQSPAIFVAIPLRGLASLRH